MMQKQAFNIKAILDELQKNELTPEHYEWSPCFEGNRSIVVAKLGCLLRCYPRPKKYNKRFYHTLYFLPIADWHILLTKQLFGGLCNLNVKLDLRFQANYKFALANIDYLPDINTHIKAHFKDLILDILEKYLHTLEEGKWINHSLHQTQQQVETNINETLITQNIQCRTTCDFTPTFTKISEDEFDENFMRKSVYLDIMRQHFTFMKQQKQEWLHQQQLLAKQEIEHKHEQLKQLEEEGDLLCMRQEKEATNKKRLLLAKEKQKQEQRENERQACERNIRHENLIKTMQYKADSNDREQKQLIEQQAEILLQNNNLEHDEKINKQRIERERQLKSQELEFEIETFEKRQIRWNAVDLDQQRKKIQQDKKIKKEELESDILQQETKAIALQKLEERMQEEKISHEGKLRIMELKSQRENTINNKN